MARKLALVAFSICFGFLIWFVLMVTYIREVGFNNLGSVKLSQDQKILGLMNLVLPPIASGILCFILTKDLRFTLLSAVILTAALAIILRPTLPVF